MEHFASEDWVDFTRSFGSSEKRQSMEEHLNSGCDNCMSALQFWTKTADAAAGDQAYEPPANVLRSVKAMGAMHLARPSRPRFALAELIMGSARLAPAGVRSGAAAPALLLYRFGGVNIDLRVEQTSGSKETLVIGQILDTAHTGQVTAGVEVAAMSDGGKEYKTTTNQFGEFQLKFAPASGMYLVARVDKRMEIWIPLNEVRSEQRKQS